MKSIAVVGASLAGVRAAENIRAEGYTGSLTVFGYESEEPYDRPPLSKQFLAGTITEERLRLRQSSSPDDVAFRLGVEVERCEILKSSAVLHATDGATHEFDGLVIATGARCRPLPFKSAHPQTVELRTLSDARRLRPLLIPGAKVSVVGAGFIGSEVASTAHALGCQVTVIEAATTPLSRQLGPEMGFAIAGLHTANGVDLRLGASVKALTPDGVNVDGEVIQADVVVVGVGVMPNTEWLIGSGIEILDGVVTDETLRVCRRRTDSGQTERDAPDSVFDHVVAAGDLARFPHRLLDETLRLEHWTNAVESGAHAAKTLLGAREPFAPIPYFWSDQYGKKIQFLGRSTGFDEVRVVDGSVAVGSWLALYRRGDRFIGALGVSKIKRLMQLRPLLASGSSWNDAVAVATNSPA